MPELESTDSDSDSTDDEDVKRTPIFGHVETDGFAFCSFGVRNVVIEGLEVEDLGSSLEYVERGFFSQDWADDLIEVLTPEGERGDQSPPVVGELVYNDEEIIELSFERPDWPFNDPEEIQAVADDYDTACETHREAREALDRLTDQDVVDDDLQAKYAFLRDIMDFLAMDSDLEQNGVFSMMKAEDVAEERERHQERYDNAPRNRDSEPDV